MQEKMKQMRFVIVLMVLACCVGCSKQAKYRYLTDKPLPVEIEVVGESSQVVENTYVGEICPKVNISLVFPLGGQITGLFVKSGDKVQPGQLIATIDSTQAHSMYESAEAMYKQACDGYERLKPLHEQGGISDVKWVEMETNLEKARSMMISSRKRLEDCAMRAQQAGVMDMRDVDVGQYVRFGEPVGLLMDLSAYNVEFTVPESEIGGLYIGQPVRVSLPALNKQYMARIVEKSIAATRMSHTYYVKADIISPEAAQELLPGMVCRAIIAEQEQNGFIISAGCIQTQQRGHSVWVLRDGKAKRQMVKISEFVENGVLITEGIQLGDTVIAKGYQKMYDGARVTF